MSSEKLTEATAATDTGDIFFMTNLSLRMTGLPMSVWVSPRGNARHDVCIKVNTTHGRQMTFKNTAVVAVRQAPQVVAGGLSTDDRKVVDDWIRLNCEALGSHWDGEIDTGEFIERLTLLPAAL